MNDKNGRIWPAIQASLSALVLGAGVWYVAARCATVSDETCIFTKVSDLWSGVLHAGAMLTAGALAAVMLSKIDCVFGWNGPCDADNSEGTGE